MKDIFFMLASFLSRHSQLHHSAVPLLRLSCSSTKQPVAMGSSSSSSSSCSSRVATTTRLFSSTTETAATRFTPQQAQHMESALSRVRAINRLSPDIEASLLDFTVDSQVVGKVRPGIADLLCATDSNVFCLEGDDDDDNRVLTLTPQHTTVAARTDAVQSVMRKLRDDGIIPGWRDETYPVTRSFSEAPVLHVERAAVPWLGCLEYGVHINGLVRGDGENGENVKMWMARRAADKASYPNMLDHLVAGGQPSGLGLLENVVKECEEEAGVPEDLVRAGVQPAGAISYANHNPKRDTITRAVMFNFDLTLPADFRPQPVDGEVQEFFLWNVDQILESLAMDYPDPIKPNCYVVIIDWLLRQGHLSPEVPGYLDVLRELRSGECQ